MHSKHFPIYLGCTITLFFSLISCIISSDLHALPFCPQFSAYPKCTLHDDFGKLLESRQLCDVEFVVGPQETRVPAHVAMVAARAHHLRAKVRQAAEARARHLEQVGTPLEGEGGGAGGSG